MNNTEKIGLGGGCHWCTEAVFQSLKGVLLVEQGFIASKEEFSTFSEAVIVTYNPEIISLQVLIEIHLLTHKSTKNHSMRVKYRSAIYTFSEEQKAKVNYILTALNTQYEDKLVTLVLSFCEFKASLEAFTNYYNSNPEKPFCETFINPKLKMLLKNYNANINQEKLSHLKTELSLQ
ncbi:MAG: peptide-methionine (S)-S-oxide reductase [Dokdonia sp.]|jgi:peptide-methionine (S)-S-oxide reductase